VDAVCYKKPSLKLHNLHKIKFNTNSLGLLLYSLDIVKLRFFFGTDSRVSSAALFKRRWLKQQFHHSRRPANLSCLGAVQQEQQLGAHI
jgi:hypothetical protein